MSHGALRHASSHRAYPFGSLCVGKKSTVRFAAMSVQAVAAKMAEVELKDVAGKAASPAISPLTPKAEEKKSENNPTSPSAAAAAATVEPSPVTTAPNPVKMPQASAMKRPDPQQNGGEAFVNCDGTVAEAPRMKKVTRVDCAELREICDGARFEPFIRCRVSLCGDDSWPIRPLLAA